MPIAHAKDFYSIGDTGITRNDTVDEFALKANGTINQIDKLGYFKYALDNKLIVPDGKDVTIEGGLIINGGNLYADRGSAQKIKGIGISVTDIKHNDVLTYDAQAQKFSPTRGFAGYYGPFTGTKIGNVYTMTFSHTSDVMVQVFGYVRAVTGIDQEFQLKYGNTTDNLENRLLKNSEVIDVNVIHQKADSGTPPPDYIRPAVMIGMIQNTGKGTKQLEFHIPNSLDSDDDEKRYPVHFLLYCSGDITDATPAQPSLVNQTEVGTTTDNSFSDIRLSRLDDVEDLKD